MRSCEEVHKEYDKHANNKVQTGSLPTWMHVNGKVAWSVFRGPYDTLPRGWNEFMERVRSMPTKGPPGDVYICDPTEHSGDENSMLTILWVPLKSGAVPKKEQAQPKKR